MNMKTKAVYVLLLTCGRDDETKTTVLQVFDNPNVAQHRVISETKRIQGLIILKEVIEKLLFNWRDAHAEENPHGLTFKTDEEHTRAFDVWNTANRSEEDRLCALLGYNPKDLPYEADDCFSVHISESTMEEWE